MRPHLEYLAYVLRHKWYVLRGGLKVGGIPLWRLIVHDWQKFLPVEWRAYVAFFHTDNPSGEDPRGEDGSYDPTAGPAAFNRAWFHHVHYGPHHWQHWVMVGDYGEVKVLPMPVEYAREMVADWYGAGMAQGKPDILGWYRENRPKYLFDEQTEARVLAALRDLYAADDADVCYCGARGAIPDQCEYFGYCGAHFTDIEAQRSAEQAVS